MRRILTVTRGRDAVPLYESGEVFKGSETAFF